MKHNNRCGLCILKKETTYKDIFLYKTQKKTPIIWKIIEFVYVITLIKNKIQHERLGKRRFATFLTKLIKFVVISLLVYSLEDLYGYS